MRLVLVIFVTCLLAGGAMAQRGGGSRGGGGGFHGGGGHMGGGGVFRGPSGGGFRGGGGAGTFRGNSGFRGGFRDFDDHRGFGFGRSSGFFPGYGYGFGLGYGYYPGLGDYGYPYDYSYDWPYYGSDYYGTGYGYGYAPNTTVVYPPQQPTTVYVQTPVHSTTHTYDQYGQEVGGGSSAQQNSSPLYLIAFQDHVIRAALSYRVEGHTLIYTNDQHEEKRVPLTSVDRGLTLQLNHERRVPMSLPE